MEIHLAFKVGRNEIRAATIHGMSCACKRTFVNIGGRKNEAWVNVVGLIRNLGCLKIFLEPVAKKINLTVLRSNVDHNHSFLNS